MRMLRGKTASWEPVAVAATGLVYDSAIDLTNDPDYIADFASIPLTGGVGSAEGDNLVVVFFLGDFANDSTITSMTLGGNSGTLRVSTGWSGVRQGLVMFTVARPAADTVALQFVGSGASGMRPKKFAIYNAADYTVVNDTASASVNNTTAIVDVATTTDCLLFGASILRDGSGDLSWSAGLTERDNEVILYAINWTFSHGFDVVTTAATPRTVRSASDIAFNHAAASLVLTKP